MNLSTQSKILIQGMMEPMGSKYVPLMLSYGTPIAAGVSPGHRGEDCGGVPVFDMVEQAIESVGTIDTSVILVQPYLVLDAALEAMAAGIRQLVIVTEGVPPLDMVRLTRKAEATGTIVVGSSSPGIIVPGELLLGIHPTEFYIPGSIGIISRSGTLIYEVALTLTQTGFGQSIAVSIGGDRILGSSFDYWLLQLQQDDRTQAIVLVGEIGGDSEEQAAHYITQAVNKPVVAYLAGRTAPRRQVMGHSSAVITTQITDFDADLGTFDRKLAAFKQAKIPVADRPSQIPDLLKKAFTHSKKQTGEKLADA